MSRAVMEELVNRALNLSGMPSVALDEGGYALVHVAGMAVNLEYDEIRERLYLYASLGKLPDSVPVALYEAVLEAGFMGAGTAGGHIGLHGPTRVLAYSLSLDAARLDEQEMANAFNLFVSRCAEWIGKVTELLETPALLPGDSLFSGPMLGNIIWG